MSYINKNFKNWKPTIEHYSNGRIAIEYVSESVDFPGHFEPEARATINLPDEHIEPDEVIIKNYSENEGIYEEMLAAGHIGPVIRYVRTGHIVAPICKLLLPIPSAKESK